MRAVSLIGRGTALTPVWNGVPALYLGVPTNVAISKAGLSRNLQAVWTARIGLRATGNGKTEAMSRRQATSSSLIGRAMEKQTTFGLVERVENGTVYTVEGNSGDACRQNSYAIGSSVIYGYGVPAY